MIQRESMTIKQLKYLHSTGLFNVTELARQIGVEPQTLLAKIRRGSPELSVIESNRIEALLKLRFSEIDAKLTFEQSPIMVAGPDGKLRPL